MSTRIKRDADGFPIRKDGKVIRTRSNTRKHQDTSEEKLLRQIFSINELAEIREHQRKSDD